MRNMANLGRNFEETIIYANEQYAVRNIAMVQKISTPWTVLRQGKRIVSAFPSGKSTLDFRGTLLGGQAISFDCKETEKESLPLANIDTHQIDYIREALNMGELSFLLCHILPTQKYYHIPGEVVLDYWDSWVKNKGKRGYNSITTNDMNIITSGCGIVLDYIAALKKG